MNAYLAVLMDKPSVLGVHPAACAVCGISGTTEHHIVPRSQGGADGPTVRLCGHGTSGCHGAAEDKRLHFRFREGWEYLRTVAPVKYERALELHGWTVIPGVKTVAGIERED